MTTENPLGRQTEYPAQYAPDVLFPVPRADNRLQLSCTNPLPFSGHDIWHAYELSWLDGQEMPQVGIARLAVPQDSPNLIESKSLKLYFNSLNQSRFADRTQLRETLVRDLSAAAQADIGVELLAVDGLPAGDTVLAGGIRLEAHPVVAAGREPAPGLLKADAGRAVREALYSHLFRSNCPVTGQPDWGTVIIRYEGGAIDHGGLLRYVLSYRQHQGFHEDCVERIFCDLWTRCEPQWLVVGIQFLRRGGLDINPWRWSAGVPEGVVPGEGMRLTRQ
ncbi:MAG: NADPH-dependent 7-cyano-7-deazaguanine reductase QueF [Pseudohongiellaceae bacterium]